jgi:hypothetical protein
MNNNIINFKLNCRSANYNESYLDIYRMPDYQQTEDDLARKLLVFYNQDEKAVINTQIIVDGVVVNA